MKKFEASKFAHWLVLLIGAVVTFFAWNAAHQDSIQKRQEEFEVLANRIHNRIEKRIQEGRILLRATTALFNASDEVTRAEFHTYITAHEMRDNYPGIKSVAISWLVHAKDRERLVAKMQKSGEPSYRIWPESKRDWSAPVLYIEPINEDDRKFLGFDLRSEQSRRAAMEVARDRGSSAVTDLLPMPNDNGEEKSGFFVFAPIYKQGVKLDTLEARRTNILGWAHLAFMIDEVMQSVMQDPEEDLRKNIALHVYFGDADKAGVHVFQSEGGKLHDYDPTLWKFQALRTFDLPSKRFTVRMHATSAFEQRVHDSRANAVLVGGAAVTILLTLLIWVLVSGRERAMQLARRMNLDLSEREERYRQMFEDNASIAYILDPESGRIIDANQAAAAFWGYSPEELRSMNIGDINQSPLAELQVGMQQQLEAGQTGQFHYRHRLKSGEIRDVEIYRTILTHQGHSYIYCIVHDITSRRHTELALCESQAKLQAIIETAMDAVIQMDGKGIIRDWNAQAEKTFGWARADVIGRPLVEVVIPERFHKDYFDGLTHFLSGEGGAIRHSHFEIELKHQSGHEFPVEIAVTTLIGGEESTEYYAFMRDITDRRKSENALRKARIELENRVFERTAELVRANRRLNSEIAERTQAQEALQQSQEMLRQLVAHQDRIRENERKRIAREIHDELGQHLLVLRIDVSMLARTDNEHPKLGERIEAILQHIDTTMKSVRAIINNLRPSVLDLGLHAALEWQAEEFQRRSGISCELVADDDELMLEDSVSTVLFRIVQEALTNVLRHAKASRVRIELRRDAGRLIMTIADNGIGIQQAQQSEHNSFGLVGIRERLHILGGELEVDSNNNGTTLIVTLPLMD